MALFRVAVFIIGDRGSSAGDSLEEVFLEALEGFLVVEWHAWMAGMSL